VINVAGMKFFPQEVEAVLEGHPGVKEACVFAQPHKQLGEVGCARVVPTDSQADLSQGALKKYCARHLAIYKVPEEIQIVDTLMRTASGKVIRRELRSGELIGGHS
jgi:long-chain acyl-CoA synthetase